MEYPDSIPAGWYRRSDLAATMRRLALLGACTPFIAVQADKSTSRGTLYHKEAKVALGGSTTAPPSRVPARPGWSARVAGLGWCFEHGETRMRARGSSVAPGDSRVG